MRHSPRSDDSSQGRDDHHANVTLYISFKFNNPSPVAHCLMEIFCVCVCACVCTFVCVGVCVPLCVCSLSGED